jgi:hypothetical protein
MLTVEATLEGSSNAAGPPLLETLHEIRRHWLGRAMAELEMGLKLSTKLSEAHSMLDAMTAYQEWWSEEISARAKDAHCLMTEGQEFMAAGWRVVDSPRRAQLPQVHNDGISDRCRETDDATALPSIPFVTLEER